MTAYAVVDLRGSILAIEFDYQEAMRKARAQEALMCELHVLFNFGSGALAALAGTDPRTVADAAACAPPGADAT